MKPVALFDAEGRKKLARLIVWGAKPRLIHRDGIEKRIEKALERIAEKVKS